MSEYSTQSDSSSSHDEIEEGIENESVASETVISEVSEPISSLFFGKGGKKRLLIFASFSILCFLCGLIPSICVISYYVRNKGTKDGLYVARWYDNTIGETITSIFRSEEDIETPTYFFNDIGDPVIIYDALALATSSELKEWVVGGECVCCREVSDEVSSKRRSKKGSNFLSQFPERRKAVEVIGENCDDFLDGYYSYAVAISASSRQKARKEGEQYLAEFCDERCKGQLGFVIMIEVFSSVSAREKSTVLKSSSDDIYFSWTPEEKEEEMYLFL